MSSNPYDKTKWGDELKDLEQSWLLQVTKDEFAMLQCGVQLSSCSSNFRKYYYCLKIFK